MVCRWDALVIAMLEEVALAFERLPGLPRLDHAAANAETAIRQGAFVVDLDGASEAATDRACAHRVVEGEERGVGSRKVVPS